MKIITLMLVLSFLFISSCVGPPNYSDGLLENTPAVINENDFFSLSLLGDRYTTNQEWNLLINANSAETLLTTLAIKDLNISSIDSTYLFLINAFGDTVMNMRIFDELVVSSTDSISHIGTPSKVMLEGVNFTGRIEYQIIINQ